MKLKFIVFIVFTIFQSTYSQEIKSLKVIYKETMLKNPIDTSGVKLDDYKRVMFDEMEKIKINLKRIDYILKANQEESNFSFRPFMENDASPNLMNAILASSADGIFYTNVIKDLNFWQIKSHSGNYYRILNPDKSCEWKITQDKKKIGGYICYKATKKILLNNKLPIKVIAWFTPEIPFSFGPKGYGGLPGLIIALDERGFYFYAEKIKFSDKNLVIDKPNKGKFVTPDEYDQLIKRKYN